MAAPSIYGEHNTYTRDNNPSRTKAKADGGATIAGFEALSKDCSSEHYKDNLESSQIGSDDDDDSHDEVVPETQLVTEKLCLTQPGKMQVPKNFRSGPMKRSLTCGVPRVVLYVVNVLHM